MKFYFYCFIFFLNACSFTSSGKSIINQNRGQSPDWIGGKSRQYSAQEYLTGVGTGKSRKDAEDNALAAIAKIFIVNIKSNSKDIQSSIHSQTNAGKNIFIENQSVEQLTQISTEKGLSDVIIAEVWQESQGFYYALAVLERLKASNQLKEKINIFDQEIELLLSEADKESNKLFVLKKYLTALNKFQKRELLNGELKIVSSEGQGKGIPFSIAELKNKITAVTGDLGIKVEMSGDNQSEITAAVTEGLNNIGFAVKKGEEFSPVDILVKGKIHVEPADVADSSWKYVRGTAEIDIFLPVPQKSILNMTFKAREGHINLAEANQRLINKLQKDIIELLGKKLSIYLSGEEK